MKFDRDRGESVFIMIAGPFQGGHNFLVFPFGVAVSSK